MKLLCLHSYGTSGAIFREQLSSLIAAVGEHHEFVFLDGEVPVTRSGLAASLPGETLAYYDGCHALTQQPAHDLLAATLAAEDPPFDGVMGYSQGASFAISFMIQHMIDYPGEPLPFQFAVFFTPGFCVAPTEDYKDDEIMSFMEHLNHHDLHALTAAMRSRKINENLDEFDAVANLAGRPKELFFELMGEASAMLATRGIFNVKERDTPLDLMRPDADYVKSDFPRFFNAIYTEQRLPIPTVHVHGAQDDPAPSRLAQIAQHLCDPQKIILVETSGMHEIPHKHPDVDNVAKAIEKAHWLSLMNPAI